MRLLILTTILLLSSHFLVAQYSCQKCIIKVERDIYRNLPSCISEAQREINYFFLFNQKKNPQKNRSNCVFCNFELIKSDHQETYVAFCDEGEQDSKGKFASALFDCSELNRAFFKDSDEQVNFFFILTRNGVIKLNPFRLFALCDSGTIYVKHLHETNDSAKWSETTSQDILNMKF